MWGAGKDGRLGLNSLENLATPRPINWLVWVYATAAQVQHSADVLTCQAQQLEITDDDVKDIATVRAPLITITVLEYHRYLQRAP